LRGIFSPAQRHASPAALPQKAVGRTLARGQVNTLVLECATVEIDDNFPPDGRSR
jgi:hypothetical protein